MGESFIFVSIYFCEIAIFYPWMHKIFHFLRNILFSPGISLESGDGGRTKVKLSMDSMQRFIWIMNQPFFLTYNHQSLLPCTLSVMWLNNTTWLFSQVFSVNNVNVVIRTRTEHLTDEEKARIKSMCETLFVCRYDFPKMLIKDSCCWRRILESKSVFITLLFITCGL